MDESGLAPGPIADQLFESTLKLAAAGGIASVLALHWFEVLSLFEATTLTIVVLLYPVYLVFVSMLLSVWLGYDEARTLRPVGEDGNDPWDHWPW